MNQKYCYWKQGRCNPGEEEFLTAPTAEHPEGKPECRPLTDIEPERLYQCLTGRHFYYCPAGAKACPAQAYTGCLGRESNLWRALNITYDEEPEDPFKHFFEVKQGYECEDSAEGITMEAQLDIQDQIMNGATEGEALRYCAQACAAQDDIFLFNGGGGGSGTGGGTNTTGEGRRLGEEVEHTWEATEYMDSTDYIDHSDHIDQSDHIDHTHHTHHTARRRRNNEVVSSPTNDTDDVIVVKKTVVKNPRPCTHFSFHYANDTTLCFWAGKPMQCKNLIQTPRPDDDKQLTYDSYRMNPNPIVRAILLDPDGVYKELDSERGQSGGMDGMPINLIKLNKSVSLPSGGNCYFQYEYPTNTTTGSRGLYTSNLTWNGTVWDTTTPR